MSPADGHARRVGRDQGRRDAVFILVADEVVRVVELESQPEHGRDGRKRDVPLVPVEADAHDGLAFPLALAHDAAVDDRRRVRAGLRRSQRKAGNFRTGCQSGEVAVFLLFGAVVQQQLGRTQ